MSRTRTRLPRLLALVALIIVAAGAVGLYYIVTRPGGVTASNTTQAAPPGDDWPTYMRDLARSGFNSGETKLSPDNAANLKLLWMRKLGNVLAAQPIVKGDTVYAGSWNGFLYALNTKDGAERWKQNLGLTTSKRCAPSEAGITSAPAVTDNALYIGGGDGFLHALNPKTGESLWKFKTGDNSETGGAYNWASPALYKGRVYMGTAAFCDRPFAFSRMYGLNAQSGQLEQQVKFVPEDQRGAGIWTSPTIDEATGNLYVTTASADYYIQNAYSIARLNPGTLAVEDAWQIPIEEQVFDGDWGTTPTLFKARDGTLMVGAAAKNGRYYAFNAAGIGKGPVWSTRLADGGQCPQCGEGIVSSNAYAYDTIYAAGGYFSMGTAQKFAGTVNALDPTTGAVKWRHPTQGAVVPALAAANGLVFAAADDTIEVLDAASGKLLWEYATGAGIYAAPTVAGGVLYVASNDGYVYAFSAGPYSDKAQPYKVATIGSNPPSFTPFRKPAPAAKLQGPEQCFADTGRCVRGGFLDFWRAQGGLVRFGPAVTDELNEAGRTVQYFRNAVLEIAPDFEGKPQVRLGKLDFRLFYYTPSNQAFDAAEAIQGATYVPETRHNLSEPFLSYWNANGGVAGLGYPVSEPFDEYNVLDDATRRVQYFERSRLELVKGPDGSDKVVLGALGLQKYKQRYGTLP